LPVFCKFVLLLRHLVMLMRTCTCSELSGYWNIHENLRWRDTTER